MVSNLLIYWALISLLGKGMHYFTVIFMPVALLFGMALAVMLTLVFTLTFCLTWLLGIKITVKESGEVVGYFRWFRFYPKR
jgi:uncharacterized membrane protein